MSSPITWRKYGTCDPHPSPMASSLRLGNPFTGAPESGWCLYSMGGSCWNQRTEPEFPPVNGMVPKKKQDGWYWEDK